MITRIRDVRRARRLTLAEVAERCVPATTAQTIGRLSLALEAELQGLTGLSRDDLRAERRAFYLRIGTN